MQIQGCKMLQVVRRLKSMKRGLKELNSKSCKSIIAESEHDRENLRQAQELLQYDPQNMAFQELEKERYTKFRQSSYIAEMHLQQASKASWVKLGDANTKYFYSVIKHRKLKQDTTQLKDATGN